MAPAEDPAKGPAHARSLDGRPVLRAVGLVATAALVFVGAGIGTAAVTLTGNITAVDAEAALGTDRPEKEEPTDPNAGSPLNILLLGSDSREGDNAKSANDGTEGARSDTTMIMHISADRSRVEMVSIPRDTTVDIPSCPTTSGAQTPELYGTKFNAAFSQGYLYGGDVESGALCTMKTVETLTDVYIDGFIVVDFSGFRKMIDAIGGVELCIPNDIDAPKADNLVLSAGVQTLNGKTALKYARARMGDGLGDQSDISRIARQQELMAALARTVLGQNLLTDSPQLLKFLGAVTGSLTMSSNFASVTGLAGLAYSARNVRPDTIAFMTAPFQYDPSNPANVLFTDEATQVWENMEKDLPLSDAIAVEKKEKKNKDKDKASTDGADTGTSDGADDTASAEPTAESSAEASPDPSPTRTRDAGAEAFTSADVTAVCG
ncbi:LytR family transcriptional attenuator [Isoptericola jiangsuensis]|uniref:LytR family transcriptional attenuator n=1 Tax=Isoptericola jiangsuensis TaxID=548579 RepID=A0A2A9EZX7_9MICO|nr:LytR family transcriptional attenuator [Isoptericola jiangsuensis]